MKTAYLISGIAGSGKSTIGKYIAEKCSANVYSVADPLKIAMVEISNLFGQPMTIDELYDPEKKLKYRSQIQALGTDIMRKHFGNDIFNIALARTVDSTKSFVIDDIRFENEMNFWLKFARQHDFETKTIRVVRNSTTLSETEKAHSSEKLNGIVYEYFIENNSSKEDLFKQVDDMLKNQTSFSEFEASADEIAKDYVSEHGFIMLDSQLYRTSNGCLKVYHLTKNGEKYNLKLRDDATVVRIDVERV